MMPIKTKNRPAPEKPLSIIRCNCKTKCETDVVPVENTGWSVIFRVANVVGKTV